MNWRLNKIQYPIYNLGPGKRIGIWVQGCSLGCIGCVNKTTWNKNSGKNISVVDIFNWILIKANEYEGITITGGEPFQQYEQLISFLCLVKSNTNLNTYIFTGYYLDELNKMFDDKLFYKYADFILDGRYIAGLHEDKNIRGSSNQTLYEIKNGIPIITQKKFRSNKWSVNIDKEKQIYMAGIPKKKDLEIVTAHLAKKNIHKRFI